MLVRGLIVYDLSELILFYFSESATFPIILFVKHFVSIQYSFLLHVFLLKQKKCFCLSCYFVDSQLFVLYWPFFYGCKVIHIFYCMDHDCPVNYSIFFFWAQVVVAFVAERCNQFFYSWVSGKIIYMVFQMFV